MLVICCIEERNGLLFHQRRVSSDRKQVEDLLSLIDGEKLYLTAYSSTLFPLEKRNQLLLVGSIKEVLDQEGYAFAEEALSSADLSKVQELIVYSWKRRYPFDVCLPIAEEEWEKLEEKEFSGHSHARIVRIRYKRRKQR